MVCKPNNGILKNQ